MPTLLTFENLKDSDIPGRVGKCPESDDFRNYTNKATRMLMNRGDFWGTVERMRICTYNSCIVWPRYVAAVKAINIAGNSYAVMNHWYEFMPLSAGDFCNGGFTWSGGACYGNTRAVNDGFAPVFNQIRCGSSVYIRAYPSTQADVGQTTRIFGIDENGQTVRSNNGDGTWSEGVELTLAIPYVSTSIKFREVQRITKEETQGVLRYYQYDEDNDVLLDLVWLEPTELSPAYRRSRIPKPCCTSTSCDGLTSVEAMVKLEFIPVKYDTDLVQISNLDALSDMMLAIKYSNAGEAAMAKDFESKAIRELNLELNNRFPNEQTPVEINPFGSAMPINHSIGAII